MSGITGKIIEYGNVWSLNINQELQDHFEALHAARTDNISTGIQVQKGIKYGPADRNRLDIYCPNVQTRGDKTPAPTVLFIHSGGFRHGDIDITPSMHAHVGYFFSRAGVTCALMTYRLLPGARYPDGADDVAMAVYWLSTEGLKFGVDAANIIAVGHSSGGAHLATAFLEGKLLHKGVKLRGIVLLSAPLWYDLDHEMRRENMLMYHDAKTREDVMDKTSVASLKRASVELVAGQELLILVAEFDTDEIANGNFLFIDEYRKKLARVPIIEVLKGHNHISSNFSIGLENDAIGPKILRFISGLQ